MYVAPLFTKSKAKSPDRLESCCVGTWTYSYSTVNFQIYFLQLHLRGFWPSSYARSFEDHWIDSSSFIRGLIACLDERSHGAHEHWTKPHPFCTFLQWAEGSFWLLLEIWDRTLCFHKEKRRGWQLNQQVSQKFFGKPAMPMEWVSQSPILVIRMVSSWTKHHLGVLYCSMIWNLEGLGPTRRGQWRNHVLCRRQPDSQKSHILAGKGRASRRIK